MALHRVSWLLFNEEALRPERMLVVGPNETFTNYIKDVLPGLGDVNVPHKNLRALGPQKSSRRREEPSVARLKGELRVAGLLRRGLHLRIRFAGVEPVLVVGTDRLRVEVPRAEIVAKLDELRQSSSYTVGRSAMRAWLTQRVHELAMARTVFTRGVEVDQQAVDRALERLWPQLSAQQFLSDLLGSTARLQEAAGDAFTAGDIGRLHRQSADKLASETWADSDVALLDEVDHLLGHSADRYDHIVVDEAQDLSPMQLRSLGRRSSNGRYTVVGDIAQSTGPWARDTWDDVVEGLRGRAPVVHHELDYGYRVPREVYDVAAKLLPLMAPGLEPLTVVRNAPEEPRFILDDGDFDVSAETVEAVVAHSALGRFIGVVVAPGQKGLIADALTERGIQFVDADTGSLGGSVNLLSATEAKGLEFDAVIVVEPAAIADIGDRGLRLLYIALTRATKYLTVVHAQAFEPLGLQGAEPPAPPQPSYTDKLFEEATLFDEAPTRVTSPTASGHVPPGVSPAASGMSRPAPPPPPADLSPMVSAVAATLAGQVKGALQPDLWPAVLAEMERQLSEG